MRLRACLWLSLFFLPVSGCALIDSRIELTDCGAQVARDGQRIGRGPDQDRKRRLWELASTEIEGGRRRLLEPAESLVVDDADDLELARGGIAVECSRCPASQASAENRAA